MADIQSISAGAERAKLRPHVRGKFIFVGEEKFYLRGVTYGPFRPRPNGCEYHTPDIVERDFALMATHHINTVRLYTVPPRWLLDLASSHGLRVLIGLPWEQHVTFLSQGRRRREIERRVREGVRACAGHPAVLGYAVGNEIPAPIVRWHGRAAVERFIHRLYKAVKAEDPGALVTYVNYPTTEYLQLPFVDFVCFNVYLESRDKLDAYLARLHNLAQDRPLILAEVGLDSIRNSPEQQADTLTWQARSIFTGGCAGMFAFAWTDEWHRGGFDIEDWAFGLTDRSRNPKPALAAMSEAYAEAPFPSDTPWPRVSVVVCTYNGSRTLHDTCRGLRELDYPDFEVVVVNDGSTDNAAAIARGYGFRVITIPNGGLSNARNVGMRAAEGQIIAYLDDDARPDPQWLKYLAWTFITTDDAGVGGPNIAPPGDGWAADCVDNAPGGPIHVLLDDRTAEHIPGCNMAFRKTCLQAIDGCDPQFRIAGDDVDLCWRLQAMGWTLGFNPAAVVWHHRRNSLKTYWKQQVNYGRAEALLEQKWPQKYNAAGHVPWGGRLYGKGLIRSLVSWRSRIYQGMWGSAPFQRLYEPEPGILLSLPMMPEWYLIMAALVLLSLLGLSWPPLLASVPVLAAAALVPMIQAVLGASGAELVDPPRSKRQAAGKYVVIGLLHLVQPLARLRGRLHYGLTPWRSPRAAHLGWPTCRKVSLWHEQWQGHEQRLHALMDRLSQLGAVAIYGGEYDPWDLQVRGGLFAAVRLRVAAEEHGGGRQLVRIIVLPVWRRVGGLVGLTFALLAAIASSAGAGFATFVLAVAAVLVAGRALYECGIAMGFALKAVELADRAEPRIAKAAEASAPLPAAQDRKTSDAQSPARHAPRIERLQPQPR